MDILVHQELIDFGWFYSFVIGSEFMHNNFM
ncbi:hypothetical protein Cyrtocomes_00182 [Candidatus Cyrtobacter comes]|uniref:Uncharacterized protein n=1 Tax=Candidatus Cyrtobacter comes TaxID=675776 RepID=A0ABU5L6S5_9RICK|nr:hypothetical protein [Candidatus Cyrtobacter comes]